MLLTPSSKLPDDDHHWAFEIKYDGWRVLVYLDRGELRLLSRNGHNLTERAPELHGLASTLRRRRLILDGELVVVDEHGRPDFDRLQTRMHGADDAALTLMVFDLLHIDGENVTRLAYEERRRRLVELGIKGQHWQTVSNSVGGGAELLAASRAQGLEGLIAKRLGSKYTPGKRSPDWLKIKNWDEGSYIIGGYVINDQGSIDALLVGELVEGKLVYRGRVELGISRRLVDVFEGLSREKTPFIDHDSRRARWIEPRLTAEVRFLAGSSTLRHAVLRRVVVGQSM